MTDISASRGSEQSEGISRRTVTKAMAWAVPAIAIAAPVPAFAASGDKPEGFFEGACKLPGNSCGNPAFFQAYAFEFSIEGTAKDVYLYSNVTFDDNLDDFSLVFSGAVDSNGDPLTFPILIPDGESVLLLFGAQPTGNSGNVEISGNIYIPWGHTPSAADDTDHIGDPIVIPYVIPATPPGQNPGCAITINPCD